MMKKKAVSSKNSYVSPILQAVHEGVTGLHDLGLVDKATMRRFDESCLSVVEDFSADEVRQLREREHVSQTVFAHYLAVNVNTVGQWERGARRPSGAAAKLLTLVKLNGLDYIQ